MAKEKKEDVKFEDVAAKDAVSIEMTKQEAEEFASFKLKKEEEEKKKQEELESLELYQMHLTYRHRVNGVVYGPGPVQVPRYLVGKFEHSERQQLANELKLNQSTKNFFNVMGQGKAVRVKDLPQ